MRLSVPGFRRPVLIVQGDPFNRSRLRTTLAVVLSSNLRLLDAPGNVQAVGTLGLLAARRGDVVIVFDPKGDADLLRRVYAEAKRAGRSDDFYLFHLGYPEVSARYNAIGSFSRITEVATRIANQLPSEGNSAAFKEFAWRFVNIIARALVALGRRPDYQQVRRYINDIEPLFVEYAREHLRRHGGEGWEAAIAELEAEIERYDAESRAAQVQSELERISAAEEEAAS